MSTPENPPAFPVNTANLGGEGAHYPDSGMTLRDYFAAKAIGEQFKFAVSKDEQIQAGIRCFDIADAMLAARNRAGEEGR